VRDIFNQELKQLGSDLRTMASQVATAIERAAESLSNGDIIVAEQVIDADERINDLQQDIDDMCIMLLARQQPVAGDLRNVISALRMAQTLERQGDLARHVAAIARGRSVVMVAGPGRGTAPQERARASRRRSAISSAAAPASTLKRSPLRRSRISTVPCLARSRPTTTV